MDWEMAMGRTVMVIGGVALGTWMLRVGGLLLADVLPARGRIKVFLQALPGALLVALVVPEVVASGVAGIVGAGATAFVAGKTGRTLFAIALGVGVVFLSRRLAGLL